MRGKKNRDDMQDARRIAKNAGLQPSDL